MIPYGSFTGFSKYLIWNLISEELWPMGYSLKVFALQVVIGIAATGVILLWVHKMGRSGM